jgi:hypothetical protein
MVYENRVLRRIYKFWGRKPKEAEGANDDLHNLETVYCAFYTYLQHITNKCTIYRVFNLKVDHQLSHEYFTSDAIYNGSAGMTLYY